MRRFSQRNSLVTLNEINITPLLDLAFVLLIIFIIVSGSIKVEQGIDLNLPEGGKARAEQDPKNVRTVSVTKEGVFMLGSRQMTLDGVERELVVEYRRNPMLTVEIRIDEYGFNKHTMALLDRLIRNDIRRIGWPMRPPGTK